jgi:hypothetical protein
MNETTLQALKSLWQSENALRRSARSAIFGRPDARQHLDEARQRWNDAVALIKSQPIGGTAAPAAERVPDKSGTPSQLD